MKKMDIPKSLYRTCFKRFIDIVFTGAAILSLSPLFIAICLIIKLTSPGPVFFVQNRLGKDGKMIKIFKFRSMIHLQEMRPDEPGEITEDHADITSFGRLIRRSKIDELPQLFSVFKGDMSLIGPRPCLPELLTEFNNEGKKRIEVRPGCSGLAQVNGNIYLPWTERWKYDAYYVDNLSFLLDFQIMIKTILLIFRGEKNCIVPFDTFVSNIK